MKTIPNILVIGEPGSGKSEAEARDAVTFPGAIFVADPHKDSIARRVLQHATGNILFDRISDLSPSLGFGLLETPTHPDPRERARLILKRATTFVEILMRRRGGDIASSPLMEEWIMALLMLFFHQRRPLPVEFLPFGFIPGTDEFGALLKGTTVSEIKAKFGALEKLSPKGLRSEVGSATRLVNAVFRNPEFLVRCRTSFNLGRFLQSNGKLIIERGDADEDVTRTILCAISMLITEHCEGREKPHPAIRIYLDESTNARTAGQYEQKKAGETRKYGLSWVPMCQHPNFPDPEGYFQNCQEKHFYRTGDYTLARKLAAFVVGGMRIPEGETRAKKIEEVTADLMSFKPGQRYVVGPGGSRKEYVPMLENPWPDWPGLREAKLKEKLCDIYRRNEYRESPTPAAPASGGSSTPTDSTSADGSPAPSTSSRASSSPLARWREEKRKRQLGSSGSGSSDA